MISVKDIINEARLGVKDFGKKTYSDYELITHINKSLRMICNYLSQRNNDFTERSVLICCKTFYRRNCYKYRQETPWG